MKSRSTSASSATEEVWRHILLDPSPRRRRRRIRSRIPRAPRCKLCAAPFAGIGGLVMPLLGHGRWPQNPKYCAGCFRMLRERHGGAEVECSLLFADVRGSTALAERMRPRDFNRLMGRFHDVALEILVRHDAIVDKFVGDEVIGILVPAMAGPGHPARAVAAGTELLRATGHADPDGPWVSVGIGIGTGVAYVGVVGDGPDTELTAMGDVVNTTARLSSAAAAGEMLVTGAAATAANLPATLPRRELTLKGKSGTTSVVVLEVAPPARRDGA